MWCMYLYSLFLVLMFACFMTMSWIMMVLKVDFIVEWLIYSANSMMLEIYMLFDWVSCLFISVVLVISSMVMSYSVSYMSYDKSIVRFMMLVLLFVGSMVLMILMPSLFSVLFGWDMLGLVSYCLVIYYQSCSSYDSGMVTVLSNRLGDVGLLLGISVMLIYGSWNIHMMGFSGQTFLLSLILLASMTKSAQMPFSSWLPMAMAAPTPISALVHSSTLVTAGVYLVIRYNKFIVNSGVSEVLLVISVSTMLMSGIMANFEHDLKKIIALSTLSQLGLMMSVLGLGYEFIGLYHLLTHAIFKSLLFMSAGAVIHVSGDNQDIRFYGNLKDFIPFVMISFYVSVMALMGYPFLSGFYSKDLIMEVFYVLEVNFVLVLMMLISLSLTVIYSLRLCYFVYYNHYSHSPMKMISLECFIMNFSMFFLMFMSASVGSVLNWMFFFDFEMVCLAVSVKLMTLTFFMSGSMLGFMWIVKKMKMGEESLKYKGFLKLMISFFSSMWMLSFLHVMMIQTSLKLGVWGHKLDLYWVEYFEGSIWSCIKLSLAESYYSCYKMSKVVSLHMILLILFVYFFF